MYKNTKLLFFLLCLNVEAHTQSAGDTLSLTLPQADKIFLEKNLQLLAAHFDIDINTALVQQARYLDNPVLNTDQNIYDGKFFRHSGDNGQVYLQIQQLIKTAGKRNKLIQLAKDGVLSASQQFNDLLRNLRFMLYSDLYTLNRLFHTAAILEKETGSLSSLVQGMDAQLQAGNISLKENIRIKSLLYSLQSDQADIQRELAETEKETGTLLQLPASRIVKPIVDSNDHFNEIPFSIEQLLDSAYKNRPDIQLSQTNLLNQQHNLAYQKALAVPDLTAGIEYDQHSTYVPDFYGLTLSIPLPLFNRNKGNIHAAQISITQAGIQVQAGSQTAEQEVIAAYKKFRIYQEMKARQPDSFIYNYDQLLERMVDSYRQRKVGLLEFIDFFEAYKDTRIRFLQTETLGKTAAAEINFTTASLILSVQ